MKEINCDQLGLKNATDDELVQLRSCIFYRYFLLNHRHGAWRLFSASLMVGFFAIILIPCLPGVEVIVGREPLRFITALMFLLSSFGCFHVYRKKIPKVSIEAKEIEFIQFKIHKELSRKDQKVCIN